MAGVLRRSAYLVGGYAVSAAVPVAGNGHDIILVQVIKGQGTRPAEVLRADADARAYGYDVGMHIRLRFHSVRGQFFVVSNIGAEFIGHITDGNRCSYGMALAGGDAHRHIDDGAAGSGAQLALGVAA